VIEYCKVKGPCPLKIKGKTAVCPEQTRNLSCSVANIACGLLFLDKNQLMEK